MRKLFLLLGLLAALAIPAFPQTQTVVTGTVTDPNGIPYANGTMKATIQPVPPGSPCVVINGNCQPIQGTVGPVPLNSSGTFSTNLWANSLIQPSGSQWSIQICISPGVAPPLGTGPQCFSVTTTISGSSQNLTTLLSSFAPSLINFSPGSGSGGTSLVRNGLMAQYEMLPTETPAALVDYSGNGNNAIGTIGSSPPTTIAVTGGLNFTGGGAVTLPATLNSALTIELFFTYNAANYVSAPQANTYPILGSNVSNYIGLSINQSNDSFDPWGPPCQECSRLRSVSPGNTYKNSSVNPVVGTNFYTLSMGTYDNLYIGGSQVAYYQNAFSSAGLQTAGNYELGGTGTGNEFLGQMYYALFYNRALSAAEVAQNAAYVEAVMAARGVPVVGYSELSEPRLIAAGDSITQQPPGLPVGWPEDANFVLASAWEVANAGVSGYKTYDMYNNSTGIYLPLYDPSATRNTIVLFGGANNLGLSGEAFERTLCIQAHGEGFSCVIVTALDQTGEDAEKNIFNNAIRSDWQKWADGFIDLAANPNLGADGASTNSTYFQADGVHPTQTGTDLIATIISRGINRIFGNTNFSLAMTYTATATQADVDQYVILGGSASAQTFTLETCQGFTGQNVYASVTDANAWTVAAAAGEQINGASSVTVSSGSTLVLQSLLTSASTGGCSWKIVLNGP